MYPIKSIKINGLRVRLKDIGRMREAYNQVLSLCGKYENGKILSTRKFFGLQKNK